MKYMFGDTVWLRAFAGHGYFCNDLLLDVFLFLCFLVQLLRAKWTVCFYWSIWNKVATSWTAQIYMDSKELLLVAFSHWWTFLMLIFNTVLISKLNDKQCVHCRWRCDWLLFFWSQHTYGAFRLLSPLRHGMRIIITALLFSFLSPAGRLSCWQLWDVTLTASISCWKRERKLMLQIKRASLHCTEL